MFNSGISKFDKLPVAARSWSKKGFERKIQELLLQNSFHSVGEYLNADVDPILSKLRIVCPMFLSDFIFVILIVDFGY